MVERLKKALEAIKDFWLNLPKPKKLLLIGGTVGLIVLAGLAAFVMNRTNSSYTVLFPGMAQQESMQVFAALQSRDIPVRRNEAGEVLVPAPKAGDAMLEMAVLGYPKTTMPFNTFSSQSGFTTTEFEKKQNLLLDLQKRIQDTLGSMTGVKNVTVTLNVPQDSSYMWTENTQISTASVTMSMLPGYTMSPKNVAGVKTLVASSVPQLKPENVVVMDADSRQEMTAENAAEDKYGLDRLGFESQVEKRIEDKIRRVLSLGYAPENIMVAATVVIDYDKMITENLSYVPEANGNGVKDTVDERYTNEGSSLAAGVPGEELNTDIPLYPNQDAAGKGFVDYQRNIDYLVSHIKQQIEKDYAQLKFATVAITVKENDLTQEKQTSLIETASKAANIPIENISLNNFVIPEIDDTANAVPNLLRNPLFWVAAGVALLVLVLLAFFLLKKKKPLEPVLAADGDADALAALGADDKVKRVDVSAAQRELEEYRSKLKSQAEVGGTKDSIVADEMRDFAKQNPEITAAMLRSWLKEDE